MSKDTIYREDAIKVVRNISENYTGKGKRDYHPHVDFIIDELKYAVPSADRPQGEWILSKSLDDGFWVCSCCGFVSEASGADILYKYCPNCGCRMKGD